MLAKKNRLKSTTDIQNVFKRGKSTQGGFLFLKYCPNGLSTSRIAFSVGVRYSKKAVDRNKAKRLLAEGLKKFLSQLVPGFDIVIYPGQVPTGSFTKSTIENCLESALTKANLVIK